MYPRFFFDVYRFEGHNQNAFVGMWFSDKHLERYENIIVPAIEENGLEAFRVDFPLSSDSIPTAIMQGIIDSRLLIFEISPMFYHGTGGAEKMPIRNANVMYEIGLAHAWRMPEEILILREDNERLPFDIGPYRVHQYDSGDTDGSITLIRNLIAGLLRGIDYEKSLLVRRAARSLDQHALAWAGGTKGRYFHIPDGSTTEQLIGVGRLLDQGLIWLDAGEGGRRFAYHWTELGREVLKYLGIHVVPEKDS